MKASPLYIPDAIVVEPIVFSDSHVYIFESCNHRTFEKHSSLSTPFARDIYFLSVKGELHGPHNQTGEGIQQQALPLAQTGTY